MVYDDRVRSDKEQKKPLSKLVYNDRKERKMRWCEASFLDKLQAVAVAVGVLLTLGGLVVGIVALKEYRETNRVARAAQLQTVDREIAAICIEHPYLDAIWVVLSDELKGKKRADAMLAALYSPGSTNTPSNFPTWNTVAEMEGTLYGPTTFNDQGMERIRRAYLLCEAILYLVNDAFDAHCRRLITDDEMESFFAYLNDLGPHPLFLHAIWFGHRGGYIRPGFAKELRLRLLEEEQAAEMVKAIYPEMLDSNWCADRGGDKCRPIL